MALMVAAARGRHQRRYDAAAVADASDTTTAPASDALLAREDEGRNRAGMSALGAAVVVMLAFLVGQVISSKAPSITITQALRDAAGAAKNGLLTEWITYQHDKFALHGLQGLLQIVGVIAFAIVLIYLFEAAKGRRPEAPGWVRYLVYAGVALTVVGTLIYTVGDQLSYSDFLNGADHSTQAARDARASGADGIGRTMFYIGWFVVILAWVLVSLNAMRVGLLTRFLGFLGILGGVLTFFLAQLPVIQIFWLVAVGVTILGKSPGGTPPAWLTGQAEPWPTQQEAREAREHARNGKSEPKSKPAKPAAKAAPDEGPSPSTSARKRKRRS
jgi:hypothetical protein